MYALLLLSHDAGRDLTKLLCILGLEWKHCGLLEVFFWCVVVRPCAGLGARLQGIGYRLWSWTYTTATVVFSWCGCKVLEWCDTIVVEVKGRALDVQLMQGLNGWCSLYCSLLFVVLLQNLLLMMLLWFMLGAGLMVIELQGCFSWWGCNGLDVAALKVYIGVTAGPMQDMFDVVSQVLQEVWNGIKFDKAMDWCKDVEVILLNNHGLMLVECRLYAWCCLWLHRWLSVDMKRWMWM